MTPMRMMILLLACVAAPAAAQGLSTGDQIRLDDLHMRQEAAERRAIDQANQLMALEARLQAERSIVDLRTQGAAARLPRTPYATPPAEGGSAAAKYPSVPDATLADSNRRVREAADNRR